MSDGSITDELQRFVDAVASSTGYRPTLLPGATVDEIAAAEAELGVEFGPQLRELYSASNGGVVLSLVEYVPLKHIGEMSRLFRAELPVGELPSDEFMRGVMDTSRVVVVDAWVDTVWFVDPDDPSETVYAMFGFGEWFGVVAHGWRRLIGMYADLAERGLIAVVSHREPRSLDWGSEASGWDLEDTIDAPGRREAIMAEYGITILP